MRAVSYTLRQGIPSNYLLQLALGTTMNILTHSITSGCIGHALMHSYQWKALNRLRTQVGRSIVNMLKWGFSNEQETCDCGIRQTMQHILVCPMMDTVCSPQRLMAIGIDLKDIRLQLEGQEWWWPHHMTEITFRTTNHLQFYMPTNEDSYHP